jgi:hypothetical protein
LDEKAIEGIRTVPARANPDSLRKVFLCIILLFFGYLNYQTGLNLKKNPEIKVTIYMLLRKKLNIR